MGPFIGNLCTYSWYKFIENMVPPAKEVIITFLQSDTPSLVAEFGGSIALMYLQPSGSGTRYQGVDKTFWEHQGEATITWGDGMPKMRCRKAP